MEKSEVEAEAFSMVSFAPIVAFSLKNKNEIGDEKKSYYAMRLNSNNRHF